MVGSAQAEKPNERYVKAIHQRVIHSLSVAWIVCT
jgi:hypothetical protein